jgi:hypothetical protein
LDLHIGARVPPAVIHARYAAHVASIETARFRDGRPGRVAAGRLAGIRAPEPEAGWVNVLLSATSGVDGATRRDGAIAAGALCADRLGPVRHGMVRLPPAVCLTNYWRFAWWRKTFDVSPFDEEPYEPELRRQAYADARPQMRGGDYLVETHPDDAVAIFYEVNSLGRVRHYSLAQARYFFAHYAERLIAASPVFEVVRARHTAGYHIRVYGRTGPPLGAGDVNAEYADLTRPFAEELVLYTMLVEPDRDRWPWRRYRREHPALYADMFPPDTPSHHRPANG